jgi:hypothetical protein
MKSSFPFTLFFSLLFATGSAQLNQTPTYEELIEEYAQMASESPEIFDLQEYGKTDAGKPLHAFIINSDGEFDPDLVTASNKAIVMIMNGIHAGETCGVDASLQFAKSKGATPDLNVVYVIIPVYNIGGALRRNSLSRANQVGPEEYGFRANRKNLDLNRDFVKADSKNTLAFYDLFHQWQPHIFVDTHTSNGADYQHRLTLITSFPEKMHKAQGTFLKMEMEPALYRGMSDLGDHMIPYVNSIGESPFEGIRAFNDRPRYSIGFAALFNTICFTTEAHMLKPYDQRVESTLRFLQILGEFTAGRAELITSLKSQADEASKNLINFPYDWKTSESYDLITFAGYEVDSGYVSPLTKLPITRYNSSKPITTDIRYFRDFEAQKEVVLPEYYLISQSYSEIIAKLQAVGVEMKPVSRDTIMEVHADYIVDYSTSDRPYEGHYQHYNTEYRSQKERVRMFAGDLLIPARQKASKYLATVFTPDNPDSFFNYNYFDSSLNQKEYFSTYLFDTTAVRILERNPTLRRAFLELQGTDSSFAANNRKMLDFIYKNSKYYEGTVGRLPVFKILPQDS